MMEGDLSDLPNGWLLEGVLDDAAPLGARGPIGSPRVLTTDARRADVQVGARDGGMAKVRANEPALSTRRDPARASDASRTSRDLRVLLATASYERDRSEHFRRSVPALRETHRCPATATDAGAPPSDTGDRVVERPLVPSRRREPTERSAGAVARTGASRSVPFRRSATSRAARASFVSIVTTFGTRRSAPFPTNQPPGRADERRRDRSSRILSFVARRRPERRPRVAPPRVSRPRARGSHPRPARPHPGVAEMCPPADAGRRRPRTSSDVRDFPRF
jgi:hypothetical protein